MANHSAGFFNYTFLSRKNYPFNMSDASGSGRCLVPTLSAYPPKTSIDAAIGEAVPRLQYGRATEKQTSTIREFVAGRDVLVVLPTGVGKSLCYPALPYAFEILGPQTGSPSIVVSRVVVCPLQSVMEDQVRKYPTRGLMLSDLPLPVGKTTNVSLPVTNALIALVCFSRTTKSVPVTNSLIALVCFSVALLYCSSL